MTYRYLRCSWTRYLPSVISYGDCQDGHLLDVLLEIWQVLESHRLGFREACIAARRWNEVGMSFLQTAAACTLAEQITSRLSRTAPNSQVKALQDLLQVRSLQKAAFKRVLQHENGFRAYFLCEAGFLWSNLVLICSSLLLLERTAQLFYCA